MIHPYRFNFEASGRLTVAERELRSLLQFKLLLVGESL